MGGKHVVMFAQGDVTYQQWHHSQYNCYRHCWQSESITEVICN